MGDHASGGRGLSAAAKMTGVASVVFPPESMPDAEAQEAGRRLFAGPCDFIAGAASLGSIPADALPEIAFAGRSNVGKSSLVNALTGRTTLARVSHTPGRTRQLNFFALGRRLMLVDLPGYGYADAGKREIEGWTRLTQLYLKGRASLRRVLLLVDARHGLKPADEPLMDTLDEAAVSYQIALTKSDKVKPRQLAAQLEALAASLKTHAAAHPTIHVTSAHEGTGIAELRAVLAALVQCC